MKTEWISVDIRMPNLGERVIVWNSRQKQPQFDRCVESENTQRHWYNHAMYSVTHWMPLPEPPIQ